MSRGEGLMPSVLAFATEQNFIGQNMATNSDQLGRYEHDLKHANFEHMHTCEWTRIIMIYSTVKCTIVHYALAVFSPGPFSFVIPPPPMPSIFVFL